MIGERNCAETSARPHSINGIFCTEDRKHGEIFKAEVFRRISH